MYFESYEEYHKRLQLYFNDAIRKFIYKIK